MKKITYRQVGDYLIPNLTLPKEGKKPLGKYGTMRMNYLKNHRRVFFDILLTKGELMKHITVPVEIDFMRVSSYGSGTSTSGSVNIVLDILRKDLNECDIVVVEDIIDSGRTLNHLCSYLKLKGAKSVRTCTLLDKPDRREVDFSADYVGNFKISFHFLFLSFPHLAFILIC